VWSGVREVVWGMRTYLGTPLAVVLGVSSCRVRAAWCPSVCACVCVCVCVCVYVCLCVCVLVYTSLY
jgi:hypothetical protein